MTRREAGQGGGQGGRAGLPDEKASARIHAKAVRAALKARVDPAPALARLEAVLAEAAGALVAGYLPIGTEIDPRPALLATARRAPLCLPVTHGRRRPLTFRAWQPGAALVPGGFGTQIPAEGETVLPDVLVVPCLAFDAAGHRLGYGAGHYDLTLAELRRSHAVVALGFAYAGQAVAALPAGPHDQPLDLIVTETEVLRPNAEDPAPD